MAVSSENKDSLISTCVKLFIFNKNESLPSILKHYPIFTKTLTPNIDTTCFRFLPSKKCSRKSIAFKPEIFFILKYPTITKRVLSAQVQKCCGGNGHDQSKLNLQVISETKTIIYNIQWNKIIVCLKHMVSWKQQWTNA